MADKDNHIVSDIVSNKKVRTCARGASSLLSTILRIIGTIVLILVTTGLIFACISLVYIKTSLSTDTSLALEDLSLNQNSVVYYYDNDTESYQELLSLKGKENRSWVDYDQIPLDVEHAIVAIEDKRFYKHHGVDWSRTSSAFFNMFLSMSNTYGGSTVTQQLIKNVTGDDGVTVQRKLTEIFRALELENNYTKKQIMEMYMNVVYFGHGCYGIGAAAEYYFNKTPEELSLAEIASIVGITNNPSMYSPLVNPQRNKERQETILFEMQDQGYISYDQYTQAVNEELQFSIDWEESQSGSTRIYTWFEDALIEDLIETIQEERGCSREIAQKLLFNGGYQIYATIDLDMQAAVDKVYENTANFKTYGGRQLQSAMVITDPATGDIKAMAGGVGEKTESRSLNRATMSKRPPGSSIKPIAVYGPAMDAGLISTGTMFDDSEYVRLKGTNWMPHNDDRSYHGVVTIRRAVVSSLNVVAAQVMDLLTPAASFEFMTQKLHFTTLVDSDMDYAPLSLGALTYGVTVREMAAGYSIFPNLGIYTSTRTFTKICDADGNVLYENAPVRNRAISEATAYWMTDIMADAVAYGTGRSAAMSGMRVAGKTGTTSDNYDRWFCGFTPYYVGTVWVGYDKNHHISWSGNPAAQTWRKVMAQIHADLPNKPWPKPDSTYQKQVVNDIKEASFTVTGVDEEGNVLYEYGDSAVPGREINVSARALEGYTLIGNGSATIIVGEESSVTFTYRNDNPEEEPPEEQPPEEQPPEEQPPEEQPPVEQPPEEQPAEPGGEAA